MALFFSSGLSCFWLDEYLGPSRGRLNQQHLHVDAFGEARTSVRVGGVGRVRGVRTALFGGSEDPRSSGLGAVLDLGVVKKNTSRVQKGEWSGGVFGQKNKTRSAFICLKTIWISVQSLFGPLQSFRLTMSPWQLWQVVLRRVKRVNLNIAQPIVLHGRGRTQHLRRGSDPKQTQCVAERAGILRATMTPG